MKSFWTAALLLFVTAGVFFWAQSTRAQSEGPGALAAAAAANTATSTTTQMIAHGISSVASKMYLPKEPGAPSTPAVPSATKTPAQKAASALSQVSAAVKEAEQPIPVQSWDPDDSRRTLFVEIARKKLTLEAPLGMCFIDRTIPVQETAYNMMASEAERNDDQVMLAAFMACSGLNDPDSWSNGLPDSGYITWLNPAVGRTTPMSRQDYLDMREAHFKHYAENRALSLTPDKKLHRTADNVSLGLTGKEGDVGLSRQGTMVISTTTVGHVPLEITLHYVTDDFEAVPPTIEELYAEMDKLVAQQIALNE